jgi:hypothetical protein
MPPRNFTVYTQNWDLVGELEVVEGSELPGVGRVLEKDRRYYTIVRVHSGDEESLIIIAEPKEPRLWKNRKADQEAIKLR